LRLAEQSDIEDDHREEPAMPEESEPLARMMTGRVGAQGLILLALAIIVILSVVLYGLNGLPENPSNAPAANKSAAGSSAPAPAAPQSGSHPPG
jgi:hypothetical protein